MSKVRTSASRASVASPAPRDGVPPASDAPPQPLSRPLNCVGTEGSASSNVRSSPRFRVPLGTMDASPSRASDETAPALSSSSKKASRARYS